MDLDNLKMHVLNRPDTWTVFGSPEDFERIPLVHKEQIHFLDQEAVKFLDKFLSHSKMISEPHSDSKSDTWPFRLNYFKSIETYNNVDDEDKLKKWIYHRGFPFSTEVYVIPDDDHSFITSWKIIVKYSPSIFAHRDMIIFNRTLNWALFYSHNDILYFAKENINDPETDYQKMEMITNLKTQFPKMNFPY